MYFLGILNEGLEVGLVLVVVELDEVDLLNLPFPVHHEGAAGFERDFALVLVEVDQLRETHDVLFLKDVRLRREHAVHDDAVVVDLADLVQLAEIVEADLGILRDEEVTHLA